MAFCWVLYLSSTKHNCCVGGAGKKSKVSKDSWWQKHGEINSEDVGESRHYTLQQEQLRKRVGGKQAAGLYIYNYIDTKAFVSVPLKVHKIEIFFGFDFEICIISLLVM